MRAFIVRPFGTQRDIDFDRVHRELIAEALKLAGIAGDTTGSILEAGNIRGDMFELLAAADLVIADISIHNANVFYELGVRHALREKRTYMIRANVDKVPFDLLTDRYLEYDSKNPGASARKLADGLIATMNSEKADSPVFGLLKAGALVPPDLALLLAVPDDFREEVHSAVQGQRIGDVGLLAEEARRLPWAREGLRRAGVAQFELKSWEPARMTWEEVLSYDKDDVEANSRLATIYQKLKNLVAADQAVERVLQMKNVRGPERAEAGSLRASNMKTRWMADWQDLPVAERAEKALLSPWLTKSYEGYRDAFADDRNHFYSGLNALAMGTILAELARVLPDVWRDSYMSDDEAERAAASLARELADVGAAVKLAMESARRSAEFNGKSDKWLDISEADLAFLSDMTVARKANRYRAALPGAAAFHIDAARRQLKIFCDLRIHPEAGEAALAVLDEFEAKLAKQNAGAAPPARVLLFTGHRLDKPGETAARFPAAAEAQARRMIAEEVDRQIAQAGGGQVVGLSGGASGGDILFHEICAERGVKTEMFIISSRDTYVAESVEDAGEEWVHRFDNLYGKLPSRILGNSQEPLTLPRWLRPAKDYSIWERSNRWMLNNALAYGPSKVTVIALWNGQAGKGPGGTKDMVETAQQRGAATVILDAKALLSATG